jgi:hypothetical protein
MAELPPRYVGIKDNQTLVRDTYSMGVLNTNQNALNDYLKRHKIALAKIAEERRKTQELNTLRKEVDELKQLVNKILETKEL